MIFGEKEIKIEGSVFPVLKNFNGIRNDDGTGSLTLFSNELIKDKDDNISVNVSNIQCEVIYDENDEDQIMFRTSLANIWKKQMSKIGY